MVRYFLLSLTFLLLCTLTVAQTSLGGKVADAESGEELIGANIVLEKNGVYITGVATDFNGNYKIIVDPGTYDVRVTSVGYPENLIEKVVVKPNQANKLDVQMTSGVVLTEVVVTEYKVPLVEQDNTTSGQTITSEQIRNLPTRNVSALAATAAGLSQADEGDAVTIRGSRSDATDYYIDGIRVRGTGSMVPASEIDQLQVITGGIEAQYGDVVGGIISITTKGPSAKFGGGIELETSEYLDDFGWNLASINLSGPILRKMNPETGKRDGQSIIGYRFAGQYLYQKDDDPPATDIFVVKDDVLETLEANPISRIGSAKIPTAETLTNEDVDILNYRPNEESTRLDITGKIDARLSDAIDITLTGSFADSENKFTPGARDNWRLMNSQNNPTDHNTRYRGNFRFRHRLGGNAIAVTDEEASQKASIIQNAQYMLIFGYEKRLNTLSDPRHGKNYFDYGYIGSFDYNYVPATGQSDWSLAPAGIGHVDYRPEFQGYTAGAVNPGLVNYNTVVDVDNENDFVVINGQFLGPVTSIWQGMHTNVNQIYDFAREIDNDLYTFNASSSFDFLPGGSDKGRHSIQFGILYEQRFNRAHSLNPFALWRVARQQVNRHILGVDTTNVIGMYDPGAPWVPNFLFDSLALFGVQTAEAEFAGNLFWQNVRQAIGVSNDTYVNVDGLSPDQLSLDMFSAQELNDANQFVGLNYYGYSYLGEKLGNDVTFDDFFDAVDERGVRTFPVAANQPIYAAAYIQDKFAFKDIIFRLGLRVDRYDANTKVLKDDFSLYEIQQASDFYSITGQNQPAGVENDYLVYTESETSNVVEAFRKGEQWYFPNGEAANDGNVIFGTKPVFPRYVNPDANIKDPGFNPDESFKDYEPQINWMPRLAFSFPISDAANFFAHYDILVQRPSNTLASALDYFYFVERPGSDGNPFSNPNLRPQRTIDYEVGFNQKLSNSSALKIAAYYKEMRDMIQRRTLLYVPTVNQYVSYSNQDFGTVKGFTFQYDLRRTNNITVTANYTLQFADGTGSDANSQNGIQSRGNLRTLFPLNFDERHRLVTTIDYRYGSGKRYNGPQVAGKDILADFGVNLQAIAVSGRPYTATTLPTQFGGQGRQGQINGARLPWNFTLNLRVDKSFNLTKPDAKHALGINAYIRIQNLLDNRNVLNVYSASGSAEDDGFLTSSRGQDQIDQLGSQGRSEDAYLSAYSWAVLNPDFFSLPRRIILGAILSF